MKKVISNLVLGAIIGILSGVLWAFFHQPKMIQISNDLPAFHTNQDYSEKEYPGLVRLSKDGQFFCSGTVISDDYVLTAAHCLVDESGDMVANKFQVEVLDRSSTVDVTAAGLNQRADYALVKGNFSKFTKTRINLDPGMNMGDSVYMTCGFPWGSSDICYPASSNFTTYYDGFITQGRLYAGMSGGPVIDLNRLMIVAVNSAVGQGYIVIMPVIGIFETLNVKVIKDEQ